MVKRKVGRERRFALARCRHDRSESVRFRIEVNTLDGKLSYERDNPSDALHVAEGGRQSLGVIITDTEDGNTYTAEEFRQRFGQ